MRGVRDCGVAVVGGAGFLGSHLVDHLIQDRGCRVLVVDNLSAGRREFVHRDAAFEHCDITLSESRLLGLFKGHDVRFVFNYAALPYVPESYARPIHVFMVNAVGAMHVVNAAQDAGCEGVLQISSAELYGDCGVRRYEHDGTGDVISRKIQEMDEVAPHSSYGAAKAAVDYYCQAAWRERHTPVIALRQFNCVGERETHPYVVPEIISQLAAQQQWETKAGFTRYVGEKVGTVCLGNNSFRDFLYAGDQVKMAVELLESGQFGEVYNLGSESGVKVYDLAKTIGGVMGFESVRVVEDESRKRSWEIWHLQSDNTKVHSVVESRPSVSLQEALRRTVGWFEENGRKWPWEK